MTMKRKLGTILGRILRIEVLMQLKENNQYSPISFWEDISILGNLKAQKKITTNLNPLVNKGIIRNTPSPIEIDDYDIHKFSKPK